VSSALLPTDGEKLAALPPELRSEFLTGLSSTEADALLDDWQFWARPPQLPPDHVEFTIWAIIAGRGFGKTRSGAEFIKDRVRRGFRRLSLIAPTTADARDIMVDGESGILNLHWRKDERPKYQASRRRIIWPNGAIAMMFTADEPERFRGYQHEVFWADELASWRYAESWDQLMLGLRLGTWPHGCVTTTPKPVPMLHALLKRAVEVPQLRAGQPVHTAISRGSTYENRANLAPQFFSEITSRYEGTRLGRQELHAEMLIDVPGALWTASLIDQHRVLSLHDVPPLTQVAIGVDPGVSNSESAAETGIIVVGRASNGHYYVISDDTATGSPHVWGTACITAYDTHRADAIAPEKNNGGDMVAHTIRSCAIGREINVKPQWASRNKITRAEPVSALYEQGRVHHVGYFGALESQMCTWVPALGLASPDRMDALVWAMTYLMDNKSVPLVAPVGTDAVSPYNV
jgi:phage terminase large subunit-like protein